MNPTSQFSQSARKSPRAGKVTDVVVLVPGFLGFDHFGGYPYFAQAVAAAIRVAFDGIVAAVQGSRRKPVALAVVPCSTEPVDTLQSRQTSLLAQLAALDRFFVVDGQPKDTLPRFHLVGHSTGGLDAELLTRESPLGAETWQDAPGVRARISSVITVCAPLAGTALANTEFLKALASDWLVVGLLKAELALLTENPQAARHLPSILKAIAADDITKGVLSGSVYDTHPLRAFVLSIVRRRQLLLNLAPASVRPKMEVALDPRVNPRRSHYLVVARNDSSELSNVSGMLFQTLYQLTARGAAHPAEDIAELASVAKRISNMVTTGELLVIGESSQGPAGITLDAQASDSIVNTLRQLPLYGPSGPDAESKADPLANVRALVVADHLDVVGDFPSETPFGPTSEFSGFLSSGSEFRAPELSQLYRSVAEQIAKAIGLLS